MNPKHEWAYPPEVCEVSDQTELLEFRVAAEVWIEALHGDPVNSVSVQLRDMMWNDAQWRMLNHTRYLARDRDDVGTPGVVGKLLDRGYVSGQVLAIARLNDPSHSDPERQVNSLRRLVSDMKKSRHLLTREMYVAGNGLPYDWQAARDRFAPTTSGSHWLASGGPEDFMQAMGLHLQFDALSGVSPADRSRKDLISIDVYKRLEGNLDHDVMGKIKLMRNKSVAHAATLISREASGTIPDGISIDEFAQAHFLLIGVYQAISANLLQQHWLGSAVATPQYSLFDGLDKPLVATEDLQAMDDFWRQHTKERDEWLMDAYRQIIPKP
jgi:hypothetical protein